MAIIKVHTQSEFEEVLKNNGAEIELCASGLYVARSGEAFVQVRGDLQVTLSVRGSSNLTAESWGSSNLRAVSWGSSNLTAVSRESSNLTAESWGSSNLTAESWGSSNLTAESWGSSNLRAVSRGSSNLRAESWGSSNLRAESRESSNLRAESWGSSNLTAVSRGSSNLRAVSRGSSNLRAESRGSSNLTAESRESSNLRAESWGSSNLRAESRGSSNLTAVSRGSSNLRAESWGSSNLTGSRGKYSAFILRIHDGSKADVPGAIVLPVVDISTPADWCEYYGTPVTDGIALLFKAVDSNFLSGRKFSYQPGTTPEAPDWDGLERECGGGLHFCSTPSAARTFFTEATKFVACPVALEDLVVHKNAVYPNKIKGRKISLPIYEVDIDGDPLNPVLAPKEIFVFGSNVAGDHAGGAARFAVVNHGAVMGVGEGPTGDSYALPTMTASMQQRSLRGIKWSAQKFLEYASSHPELRFKVTRVGCGIAGFTNEQIAPLFAGAPNNCRFDPEWASFGLSSWESK